MPCCLVVGNCVKNMECDLCVEYSLYKANDKRILSPAQLDKMAEKKAAKRALKSKASIMGKRNKLTGYRSESYMKAKYAEWGVNAIKQPGSGKFKGKLGSDFKVTLLGRTMMHEDKTRQNATGKFKKVKDIAIMYSGFCVLMNESSFKSLVMDNYMPFYKIEEDKGNKGIHGYFDQDGADIVSIRLPKGKECIYAVSLRLWEEYSIKGRLNNG